MVPVKAEAEVALSLLMDRLSWPVKMVRWKTAKAIKELIESESTRKTTAAALLRWLADRQFESEVISGLSVLLATAPEARPSLDTLCAHIAKPSLLSELIVEKMYLGGHCNGWEDAHSGEPPEDFAPSDYFEKYKKSHVPPIFSNHCENLETRHGLPFTLQWAHEWQTLTDQTQTERNSYPNHFGDFGLQRSGIIGQFVQRQSEVYRSAYLRTLAFAVSAWRMPPRLAANYAFDALSILPGLFDVEPQARPRWLSDLPARCLAEGADLESLGRQIANAGTSGNDCLVALGTPLPADIAEFGDLTLSAFFVTDDFILSEGQVLEPAIDWFFPDEFGFNTTRESLEIKPLIGQSGSAVPVCAQASPGFHGFWHDEYLQRGLLLPAPYCFDEVTVQRADASGLSLTLRGQPVASADLWHDAWTPLYAKDSPTRCGIATTMRRDRLDAAVKKFDMTIGWCLHLAFMKKDDRHSDLTQHSRTVFFR